MKLTQRSRYGLRALFDLAYHSAGRTAQVREIAARQAVPVRYLEQLLGRLRREGFVVAQRGRKGGYVLARAPGEVTVGAVIRAMDGVAAPADRREAAAFPSAFWGELEGRIDAALDELTLLDLCRRGEAIGLHRADDGVRPMYFI